jgi:hypothetical protein
MHTISGSRLITAETDDIAIKLELDTNICEVGNTGYKTLQKISLVDSTGAYIDNNGDPTPNKYQFMLDTSSLPIGPDV